MTIKLIILFCAIVLKEAAEVMICWWHGYKCGLKDAAEKLKSLQTPEK